MSLRTSLLTLYGLLIGVLLLAVAGFYWAVERSLADQELLKTTRRQLRELEEFSVNVNCYFKETEDFLVLGTGDLGTVATHQKRAEESIGHLIDSVVKELELLERLRRDYAESEQWKVEAEERDELLRVRAAFKELCDSSDAILARRKDLSEEKLSAALRKIDAEYDNRLLPELEDMAGSERAQAELREQAMLGNARRFEGIAVIACAATLAIVVFGTFFLRRALRVVAQKEGAEAADRAKSQFLANMSHEIRTPMTAILGFVDILGQGVTDPEKAEAIQIVKRNGEHLLEIINDILDLSKIDAELLEIDRVPCSPWQIVADVSSLMRVRAAAKGVRLTVKFEGSIPQTIVSNGVRLRQILINLVGNAIKFTDVGSVQLVTQLVQDDKGESKLRFDVIDTGVGMSPEGLGELFKPFSQLASSSKVVEGTGLGLAISQRLARILGGEITVTSVRGKGSTFSLSIPTGSLEGVVMIAQPEESVSGVDREGPPVVKERRKLHGRILLVEDGPDNQRLIGYLLRRAGAEVTLAENGLVALEKVKQASLDAACHADSNPRPPFDVILLDMQMPMMDGYEVARELRRTGYRHPIVALTAYAMSTDRQKCLDAGCDDFATKPISQEDLLKALAAYMPSEVQHEEAPAVGATPIGLWR